MICKDMRGMSKLLELLESLDLNNMVLKTY